MLKTAVTTQETGAGLGVNQELLSPTRTCTITTQTSLPSSGLLLSPANSKTTSNGSTVPSPPLEVFPTFVPSPVPSSPMDHVPGSPLNPRLPSTPSSPRSTCAQEFSPSSTNAPSCFPVPSAPQGISILEKLIKTCPVWLQLGISLERAKLILHEEAPGIFLVRKNACMKSMILSVRLSDQEGAPQVQDLLIKEAKSLIYLDGSLLVFDDIFKLIAFYCVSRDILPLKLRLPWAIEHAPKYEDMEMISSLGSEFWGSALNTCPEVENASGSPQSHHSKRLGEMEPPAEDRRFWYVNAVFIEEHCDILPCSLPVSRSQSLTTPGQVLPRYKRPPPLPPRPVSLDDSPVVPRPARGRAPQPPLSVPRCAPMLPTQPPAGTAAEESADVQPQLQRGSDQAASTAQHPQAQRRNPPVPPRRRPSDKRLEEHGVVTSEGGGNDDAVPVATLVCIDNAAEAHCPREALPKAARPARPARPAAALDCAVIPPPATKPQPVAPPRKKRQSQVIPSVVAAPKGGELSRTPLDVLGEVSSSQTSGTPPTMRHRISTAELQGSDVSLYSPEGGVTQLDPDSYSTSSTEEEGDAAGEAVAPMKRSSTIMLGKAKQRLSMVNFSNIFTRFMCADRKLKKRIVELAQDRDSYFGNLVRDYRAFTLDTMEKHNSSTEMLQEIRLMMTQLKNYLIQSVELKAILEPVIHPEEKLEVIIEAALCKSVLKPLREAIYSRLSDIHTQDDSLERLREHQRVVLSTTTTDLGITTSVPEASAMEKIQLKLGSLHKEYSPEKKITILLKTCKIIYDSMSVSSPGKPYGADDFLPVLMYVLVRSNMAPLLLDVEYMMELMDPALQLGEGSYYLTTTYGALEHIKNYDKLEVTGQLSLEIQDSIHRWERRRTLNKARGSRTTVQNFINVSFLEAGSNTKTLGAHQDTTALDLCNQCAKKFEVLEPDCYGLFVLVDGQYRPLAPDELPLSIKSSLHHSEPRKEYYFVYRPGTMQKEVPLPEAPGPSDSLI